VCALACASVESCSTNLDCSLNGLCVSGACKCDPQWNGDSCQLLNLKPARVGQQNGFQEKNTASWGGSVVKVGDQYHMMVARMADGCGLNCWEGNSEIAHAVSADPLGPFVFQEIVLPYFAHGPTIHQTPDGTFVLFHLGCSTPGHPIPDHAPCKCPWNNGTSPPATVAEKRAFQQTKCGSDIIWLNSATSITGPWTSIGRRNPAGASWASGTTNPGLFFYSNSSQAIMAYRGNAVADSSNEYLGIAVASSWKTEFQNIGSGPIVTHIGEDPYIYADKRGNFHIVYHDMQGSDLGGHAFSADGQKWYNGAVPCYTGLVHFENGSSQKFKKRQRPQLIVENGVPLYLYTGVMPGGFTGDYSFTFAQEINQS